MALSSTAARAYTQPTIYQIGHAVTAGGQLATPPRNASTAEASRACPVGLIARMGKLAIHCTSGSGPHIITLQTLQYAIQSFD